MKELVTYLAVSLAGRPEEVSVTETPGEAGTLLELAAADDDLRQLIGKHGRTVRAMRSLLAASAAKSGRRFQLKITGEGAPAEAATEAAIPEEAEAPV